jgi:hypothetical protein
MRAEPRLKPGALCAGGGSGPGGRWNAGAAVQRRYDSSQRGHGGPSSALALAGTTLSGPGLPAGSGALETEVHANGPLSILRMGRADINES